MQCFKLELESIKCVVLKYPVLGLLGKISFNRRSLHHIGTDLNPYEQAISIIGKTLAAFDEDNLIPCFGFGDGISLKVHTMHFNIYIFLNQFPFEV